MFAAALPRSLHARRGLLAAAAAATALLYAAELAGLPVPSHPLGIVPVGLSTVLAVGLLAVFAAHQDVPTRHRRLDLVAAAVALGLTGALAAVTPGPAGGATGVGLLAATAAEEGLFRVAPVLLAAAVAPRWSPRVAGPVLLACSTIVFTLLPGHLAQLPRVGLVGAVGFPAAALLFWLMVHRLRLPVLAAVSHALIDQATFSLLAGRIDATTRAVCLLAVLAVPCLVAMRASGGAPATSPSPTRRRGTPDGGRLPGGSPGTGSAAA